MKRGGDGRQIENCSRGSLTSNQKAVGKKVEGLTHKKEVVVVVGGGKEEEGKL